MMKLFLKVSTTIVLIFLVQSTIASEPRFLLTGKYQKDHLRKHLIPFHDYDPFPKASERGKWENILPSLKDQYISRGNEALNQEWPQLPASLYLSFKSTGGRVGYSKPYHERRDKLADLVLAECIQGKGTFLEQIVDGIWLICEETTWCIPIHLVIERSGSGLPSDEMVAADPGLPDVNNPVIDLFAAETANLLAWTFYLLGDQLDEISPLIKDRIQIEVKRRIIDPLNVRDDYWWLWTPGKEHTDTILTTGLPGSVPTGSRLYCYWKMMMRNVSMPSIDVWKPSIVF